MATRENSSTYCSRFLLWKIYNSISVITGNLACYFRTVHSHGSYFSNYCPVCRCPKPGCERSFTYRKGLLRHAKEHSGVRVKCTLCTRTFKRRDKLRDHLKSSHWGQAVNPSEVKQIVEVRPTKQSLRLYESDSEILSKKYSCQTHQSTFQYIFTFRDFAKN